MKAIFKKADDTYPHGSLREQPEMKILHLTLKKKWFDMIESGEKKEEYREWKPYWAIRLCGGLASACAAHADKRNKKHFIQFDVIRFKNGYSKTSPTIDVKFNGIYVGQGKYKWGAPTNDCFVIKLGEIIKRKTS